MQVSVNGKTHELPEAMTVAQLVEHLGLSAPLAVELNRQVCPKQKHSETPLQSGDVVEVVTIVGGG